MSPKVESLLFWAPRVIGIGATLFLALFALDAFDGPSLWAVLPEFAMHLVPAACDYPSPTLTHERRAS